MTKKILVFLFFLLRLWNSSFTQILYSVPDTKQYFTNIYTNLDSHTVEVKHLTATATQVKNPAIALQVYNAYVLDNNINTSLIAIVPVNKFIGGVFTSEINIYKTPQLHFYKTDLGFAKKITNNWSIGLEGNILNIRIPNALKNIWVPFFTFSSAYKINESWNIGLKIYNPWGGVINAQPYEKIMRALNIGVGYTFSNVGFSFECVKEEKTQLYAIGSIWTLIYKKILLGMGYNSGYQKIYGVIKCNYLQNFNFISNFDFHPFLGASGGLIIGYVLK